MIIRPYEDVDRDPAVEVWARATAVGHPFLSEAFLREERVSLRDEWLPGSDTTVVLDPAGALGGFVTMVGDEVAGLFVDPRLHGQGYGHALLAAVLATRTRATLGVFEENHRAREFYRAHAFTETGDSGQVDGHTELRMAWGAEGSR